MLDDLGHTHDHVARSRALIGSARTLLHDVVAGAWDELERTGELQQEGRADLRLAMSHSATACRAAIDLCVAAATTTAIKRGSPIDRALPRHRDGVAAHRRERPHLRARGPRAARASRPAVPMI